MSCFHGDSEIGSRRETHFATFLRGDQPERDGEMRLASAARAEEDNVFSVLDKTKGCKFLDLSPRRSGRKCKIVCLQRFDGREACCAG